jgi:Ca-activated chloride channel homolog
MQIRHSWLLGAVLAALVVPAGPVAARAALDWHPLEGEEDLRPAPDFPEQDSSPFLLRHTGVRALVTGPVAHVVVIQTWENPNRLPVDGLYIFPLPENAAVTDMQMRIGDRLIRADMKRREEARAIYERARREGRLAGLLDQERPNIFAQQVANLMPGARVEVTLEFDHTIGCEDGTCTYVFPTVVGPRFIPARQADPGRIDPPVVREGSFAGQTLDLTVDLEGGVPVRSVSSPSHKVTVERRDARRVRVSLEPGGRLDRDVRVMWRMGGTEPEAGLLAWRDPHDGGEPGVFSLILQPPADPDDAEAAPRELVFVLDCSGSMHGEPLRAAKEVVRRALRALRPGDTFQIIRFSETASGLGAQPLDADPRNLQRALAWLESLNGEGGTEMIAGIRAALDRPADPRRLRVVAFLTDGYIGNESDILGEVRRLLGPARLFSFGIGSSVNRYLLEGLAEEGRGAAAFLGPRETPDDMVRRFVRRIDSPVLTDIRLTWEDVEVEDQEPALIPDLFAGQQVIVQGRYRAPGEGALVVSGTRRGRRWEAQLPVRFPEEAADHAALGRLWARARIHALERELHDGPRDDVREAITTLGLRHRLVTAWTSLVAVDSLISNTTGSSTPIGVPVEMPQDVSYEGTFGAPRQAAVMLPPPLAPPPRLGRGGVAQDAAPGPGGGVWSAPRADGKAAEHDGERVAGTVAFTRLTLIRADGSSLVLEDDGELWLVQPHRRSLRARLSAAELQSVRAALVATTPSGWSGRETGSRLVVETTGRQYVVNLPAAAPEVGRLVALLEARGR